eukprot:4989133-Amphidinium_carterae.1
MGHMSRSCPQQQASSTSVKPTYFTLDFVTLPVPAATTSLLADLSSNFFTEAAGYALVDTGAVHALIGVEQFLELDRKLESLQLGVVKVDAPACVAGVGGQTQTLAGVRVPVALGGLP